MATAPITKQNDKTQVCFVISWKSPDQREAETIHSLFVNVEGKSSQDINKPKIWVKGEHYSFGLGHLGRGAKAHLGHSRRDGT